MLGKQLNDALRKAIENAGSEIKLSKISGITQANINNIKNEKIPFDNIKLGTLSKLFPAMQIDFFGSGSQRGHIAKIVKMLNRLTDDEQMEIMLAIATHYPQATDDKIKNFVKSKE